MIGTVIYQLIRYAWTYSFTARMAEARADVEVDVSSTIDALTAISVSGQGALQEVNKSGNKISAMVNAQGVKPPRITYQVVGNDPSDTKYAASKLDQMRVKIACHARTYEDASAALEDLRKNIDRFSGSVEGTTVQSVQYLDQADQYSEKADVVGIAHDYKLRIAR